MSRPSEDNLIARYFAPLAGDGGLGLRDDSAVLTPREGHDLVLTADALVAGVHFFADDPPASIARKALAVNVSDLAAKGADPAGFLLSLALPEAWTEAWLAEFADGLGRAARDWRCPLLGGDTVRASGGLTLSVTAVGEVPSGAMVLRSNAQPGDLVCVTGTIGDAALGLALRRGPGKSAPDPSAEAASLTQKPEEPRWASSLTAAHRRLLLDRYLHPQPRIALSPALRAHAHAAMDVSDGLAGDLAKMLRASGVTAVVDADRLPLSDAAGAGLAAEQGLMERILTGGDDYEILCTVAPEELAIFRSRAQKAGVPLAPIGQVVAGSALPLFRWAGEERRFELGSFSHF